MYEGSGSLRTVKLLNNIVQRLADQMPICSRFYSFATFLWILEEECTVMIMKNTLCISHFNMI